jgi:hypothetical protein
MAGNRAVAAYTAAAGADITHASSRLATVVLNLIFLFGLLVRAVLSLQPQHAGSCIISASLPARLCQTQQNATAGFWPAYD